MEIDCSNCGRCCYTHDLSEWISEKTAMYDYDDPLKPKSRENTILLEESEIKQFWEKCLWICMSVKHLMIEEGKISFLITLKNFPKFIDNKWVLTCPFLDPQNKKCRIYDTNLFPNHCKEYPFDILNSGGLPFCQNSRIKGELTNNQKKISLDDRKISLTLGGLDSKELEKRFAQDNNSRVLGDILHSLYGFPEEPKGKEREFISALMSKANEEIKFHEENFD